MRKSGRLSPSELRDAYGEVRATTERLASVLSAEDQTVQTMADVSPTKWHRAHVDVVLRNVRPRRVRRRLPPFNEAYRLHLQLVLRDGRGAASPTRSRPAVAAGIEEIRATAPMSTGPWTRCSTTSISPDCPSWSPSASIMSSSTRSCSSWTSSTCSRKNPLHPAYLRRPTDAGLPAPAQGGLARARRRSGRGRPPWRRIRLRQRVPGSYGPADSVRSGRSARHLR